MIPGLVAHPWQSTLFAGAAWLLTLALQKNRAQVRYWVWFSASIKFLIPFSLLVGLGTLVPRRVVAPPAPEWVAAAAQIGRPLTTLPAVAGRVNITADADGRNYFAAAALVLWAFGFAAVAVCWLLRWRRIHALRRSATLVSIPTSLELDVPVMSAPGLVEPGIFGIFQPVLLLPEGIGEHVDHAQLDAILAHELCHVRRHDNLTAAIHIAVQAIFWFHPLAWWLGARLVDEREHACDEEVLRLGSKPQVYAEAILNVCRLYVESPLVCLSGVTGSNLKKRIEAIMKNRIVLGLNFTRKAALALAGIAAVAVPIVVGITNARPVRAQSSPRKLMRRLRRLDAPAQVAIAQAAPVQPNPPQANGAIRPSSQRPLTFDVASVKPASVPDGVTLGGDGMRTARKGSGVQIPRNTGGPGTDDPGRIHYPLITLKELLGRAWGSYFEIESPGWLDTQVVAVEATMPPDTTKEQFKEMLRNLITDRFELQYHTGTKEAGGYTLSPSKNGPKMKESVTTLAPTQQDEHLRTGVSITAMSGSLCRVVGLQATMNQLVDLLPFLLRDADPSAAPAKVTDATGLTAKYDFTLEFSPRPTPVGRALEGAEALPDIFSAMQSQLGLKLERTKVAVEVMIIDHMERTPKLN
jgi:bla regulator protein blaR1